MTTNKKLTVEERKSRALKKMEEAKRELETLESVGFWEINEDKFKDFWKDSIKEKNKGVTDFVLLTHFIKTVGIKGIEVVKKAPAPKKKTAKTES